MSTPAPAEPQSVEALLALDRVITSRVFRLRYRNDPVAFARECIEWDEGDGLSPHQEEILQAIVDHHRAAVRGPHGLGKTTIAAIAILWFALTRDGEDWKIAATASVWRQLSQFLWPEVTKWSRRLRWDVIGRPPFDKRRELLKLQLSLSTGQAFTVASDEPSAMEGAHAESLFFVYDEAKAIKDETFDATEGAFSTAGKDGTEAFALAISTPGLPLGRFYDIHTRKPGYEDWWVRHVTLDEAIAAGRITQEWVDQRKLQWGEESSIFINRVLGEFAADDEAGVIPLSWLEAAIARWKEWDEAGRNVEPLSTLGVDLADGGADKTVFAPRFGQVITELKAYSTGDTMTQTGRIVQVIRRHGGKAIVDAIGIGAGVVARLRELSIPVLPFVASEKASGPDQTGALEFFNRRSEAWWQLREQLDPSNGATLCLPPEETMIADLLAPRWTLMSGGKIKVESKDDIKKRLSRSTDYGDAVVQACYAEASRRGRLQVYQWG